MNGRSKLVVRFAALLPVIGLLTGCWDRIEIEDRAVILAIAIDKARPVDSKENSSTSYILKQFPDPKAKLVRITVQIAVPGRIPLGTGSSGSGSSIPGEKPVWVLSAAGHTIDDAINNLQQKIAANLFFGHLRIVVISKELAEQGIMNIKDFFRRQPQVRRTVWMIVSKGKAEQVMTASPQLERVPSLYLLSAMNHAVELGKLPNDILGAFFSACSAKGQEGFMPYIDVKNSSSVELKGLAYFNNDQMAGTTTALEIGQYMLIKGLNPGGYSVVIQVPDTQSAVLIQAKRRRSSIHLTIKDGHPHFSIRVMIEADLKEKSNDSFNLSEAMIPKIEQSGVKAMIIGIQRLITRTQEDGSDIFGFGEYVRAYKPGFWNREVRTKANWQRMYKEVTFDIHGHIKIRRIGAKTD